MNCSTSVIGITTAVADAPLRGTAESAMPRIAEVMTPSRNIHAKSPQRAGSSGSGTWKTVNASSSRITACSTPVTTDWPILPMK